MRKSITIFMTFLGLVISADLGAKKTKELIPGLDYTSLSPALY